MKWVIALSAENVRRGTGGPFGAAIFEVGTGRLVAPGVNLVVSARASILHAEVVSITLAQIKLDTHDLSGAGRGRYELVTSAEPCVMCLGALLWSGVTELTCGARDADVRAIGFDEGPKRRDWVASVRQRGITVQRDVGRAEARAVLQDYAKLGGRIYNGRAELKG